MRLAALAFTLIAALGTAPAQAQTTVQDAWIRGTVAGQKATGLFMTLTSAQAGKLVGGSSPVAATLEIHEMAMAGDVMKMRELTSGLALPAGRPVELKPGGYHVMLMGLKKPLGAGEVVPVTLEIAGADGKRLTVDVKATVRALADAKGHKH